MPAKGTHKRLPKTERLCRRRQVAFSDAELLRVKESAARAGVPDAKFMRLAVLAQIGEPVKMPAKSKASAELLARLTAVEHHLKKIGGNVNQLAHQANMGLVPLTVAETAYLKNAIQLAVSDVRATAERVLTEPPSA